ncbi:MAG TPA: type II CAAX endopeptidase family protein [Candidatus Limnocylindria bacterium]|nr:type II CAAX endopeptidase family protein [Candidatus Limnocylindria bacterium]
MGGLLALILGLATAAGQQLVARRSRPAEAYHGPAPLILFFLQLALVSSISIVLFLLGVDLTTPVGFVGAAVLLLLGYMFVVTIFVVRSGALSWRDIIRAEPLDLSRATFDIAIGVSTMFGVAIAAAILGGLIANLLNTTAPDVVPPPQTGPDIALTALAAGLLVPIGEEVFFRGYAMTAWLRDLGPRAALIRGTVFFALVHVLNITTPTFGEGLAQAILEVSVIAPVGFALGWLYLKRGLIASIGGHAAFNLIGVLLLTLAQSLPAPGS